MLTGVVSVATGPFSDSGCNRHEVRAVKRVLHRREVGRGTVNTGKMATPPEVDSMGTDTGGCFPLRVIAAAGLGVPRRLQAW